MTRLRCKQHYFVLFFFPASPDAEVEQPCWMQPSGRFNFRDAVTFEALCDLADSSAATLSCAAAILCCFNLSCIASSLSARAVVCLSSDETDWCGKAEELKGLDSCFSPNIFNCCGTMEEFLHQDTFQKLHNNLCKHRCVRWWKQVLLVVIYVAFAVTLVRNGVQQFRSTIWLSSVVVL